MLETRDLITILTAILIGTISRILMLKEDFRQYPSYPNGYLIHLITGFIAASLGAVAIPALLSKNYVAVTFLVLAIQQFRDIRKMERDSLKDLEETEYTFRGAAYIDGIAKTFEARSYFSLIVSLFTALTMYILPFSYVPKVIGSVIVGFSLIYILKRFSKGKTVGDIAEVKPGKIEIKGSELYVDDIFVSNLLGGDNSRELFQKEGMAVVVYPKKDHFRIALDHFGQRQAMLFEATRAIGLKRYHFTRKDYEKGRIVVTLVPILNDYDKLVEAVIQTPLLETVKKSHSVMNTNLFGEE
ncbi:YIEGIA family protein [Tepidibacillus infernus]|uniref:YIEGIA protein n=1 Tax=Tepidibacillus decaturensis TaxID=1413211 RepID=A0A135L1N3_9BACI|nr:YIEGIA family protein [Tepidibacillus decaturensis]KXG42921.1 YIEGIA protein [Tepidibacillus decaturensis]